MAGSLSTRRLSLIVPTALVLSGCGGGGGTSPDPSGVATVRVTPVTMEMEVGESAQLNATAFNGASQTVTASMSWTSSNGSVVSVTQDGSVVGLTAGESDIRATAGGQTGISRVTVTEPLPPEGPTGVLAFGTSDRSVTVFWVDRSDNETGFTIERDILGGGPTAVGDPQQTTLDFGEVGSVGPDENSFVDNTVQPNTSYVYRVSACNEQGCTQATASAQATTFESLLLQTQAVPAGRLGDPYQEILAATGGDGTYIWTLIGGSLPDGVTLNATGFLGGTPFQEGTFDFAVKVQSGGQEIEHAYSLFVASAFLLHPDPPSVGRLGVPYAEDLEVLGGEAPFTFALTDGALPDGVSLDPNDGSLDGTPTTLQTAQFTIEVQDFGGQVADREFEVEICETPPLLAIGESRVVQFPDRCAIALDGAPGDYRVALVARQPHFGSSTVPRVLGGLQLSAVSGQAGVDFPAPPMTITPGASGPDGGLDPQIRALAEATERLHFQLREEEYRSNATAAPSSPLGPPLEALGLPVPQPVDPPTNRTFWVNNPTGGPDSQWPATLRGFNASVEYYEEDGVGAAGTRATDGEVQAVLDYYHTYGTPIINDVFGGLGPAGTTNNFRAGVGGPVLTVPTDDIDQNTRFIILQVRPDLMPSGAAAYVSSCDRRALPQNWAAGSTCSRSNQAEITYISRPSSGFYLGTAVHEAKHVSSHGYAVFANRGFNPSHIEEGTAEIAKEKSSRDAVGVADGVQLNYDNLYPRTNASYGMTTVTSRSRSFLRASPLSGLVGNPSPNPNGNTYYGAGWLFHRFLADNYAGGNEDTFFHALNTGGAGISRIEQVVGKTHEELQAEFVAAISVEGEPAAKAAAPHTFQSYDMAHIAQPFNGTWPYLQGTSGFVDGAVAIQTHYTSPNFFEFSSSGGAALRLDAYTASGEDVDALDDVVLVVTRIR